MKTERKEHGIYYEFGIYTVALVNKTRNPRYKNDNELELLNNEKYNLWLPVAINNDWSKLHVKEILFNEGEDIRENDKDYIEMKKWLNKRFRNEFILNKL